MWRPQRKTKGPRDQQGPCEPAWPHEPEGGNGWVFLAPGTGRRVVQGSGKGTVWRTHRVCRGTWKESTPGSEGKGPALWAGGCHLTARAAGGTRVGEKGHSEACGLRQGLRTRTAGGHENPSVLLAPNSELRLQGAHGRTPQRVRPHGQQASCTNQLCSKAAAPRSRGGSQAQREEFDSCLVMPSTGKGQETEEASCSVSPPVLTHGARQLVRWKANILEILSACPGVTLGEDTAPGWAPAIRPAGRPTPPLDKASAAAADVWLTGLQHLLTLTVAACLGQTQESDPEEQRLGASGTRRAGSWCPRGRLPGETHPGRVQHLPATSWPQGQQTGKPAWPRGGANEAEECCPRPGGKISTWAVGQKGSSLD